MLQMMGEKENCQHSVCSEVAVAEMLQGETWVLGYFFIDSLYTNRCDLD